MNALLPLESPPTDQVTALDGVVGHSESARQLRGLIRTAAAYPAGVLISGPCGTGKELIARTIHQLSSRAAARFIPVDCASLGSPLGARYLFGRGKDGNEASEQENMSAVGCFRAADGGTIFLDEVGAIELPLQAQLLQVLQQRAVVPVGSHDSEKVDVRVIASSSRDLRAEVAAGRFREDLYLRLNVISIETLPLRQRGDDVVLLAEHILRRVALEYGVPAKRLSDGARRQLRIYDWPGNVRELENAIERAVLFSSGEMIEAQTLPGLSMTEEDAAADEVATIGFAAAAASLAKGHMTDDGRWLTAAEVECEHIARTLERAGYNQSVAARLLDIDRHQLRRRMQEYGLMAPGLTRRGRPATRSVLRVTAPRKAA